MTGSPLDFGELRQRIVGVDSGFDTPFGRRMMVYCDYTASGRCLDFVERYMQRLQQVYANTHTEDDLTGRSMTSLLHDAERLIKEAVNAGPQGRLVACGTGATGAIDKLQQIVGVMIAPATRAQLGSHLAAFLGAERHAEFERFVAAHQPVVFVGPYEHHSNQISWRQGLATVVEVGLDAGGGIDLAHLESLLREPAFQGRLRIGSFSAASNVTGMRTPVHEVARLLHRHHAFACFDFAASAPYVDIDMNPRREPNGEDASLDAVFISPHKFLGGPGSSGLLVFNERLYHRELPPSVAAGGTVAYVSAQGQDFIEDIEEREKAGTPGVLQTIKAALAFELKAAVTVPRIEAREQALLRRALARWTANPSIEILGNPDPARRIGIVSFNLRDPQRRYLHPKFVTALLNDLFGIQSRAGCSCAGPYGHRLLGIDDALSARYRTWVGRGYAGIKPGWCRVGLHYAMDDAEADYVIDAIDFLGREAHRFLPLYRIDLHSGSWLHVDDPGLDGKLSLDQALTCVSEGSKAIESSERSRLYARYLAEARDHASRLVGKPESGRLAGELGELQFFAMPDAGAASAAGDQERRPA